MRGRYFDGRSATAREVDAGVDGDALRFVSDGVPVSWPLADLRRRHVPDADRLVVAPKHADGAHLVLASAEAAALIAAAPHLRRASPTAAALRVAAPLTAVAAGVAGFVFFGMPALSGPLARTVPPKAEVRLGAQARAMLDLFTEDCDVGPEAQAVLDDLAARLAAVSDSPFALEIVLVEATFPNALALPGGRILVTDDLLDIMETPEELAGVLAHETAHVARRHAMAAVLREIGYGFVLDLLVGGGSGAGQQIALAGASLDSLRHSRGAEAEADALALGYLQAADIDATGLAQFFERLDAFLAEQDGDDRLDLEYPELLNTHPNTRARAETARANAGPSRTPALSEADWRLIKSACDAAPEPPAPPPTKKKAAPGKE